MEEDLLLEEEDLPFPEGEDLLLLEEDPFLEEAQFLLPETQDILFKDENFQIRSPSKISNTVRPSSEIISKAHLRFPSMGVKRQSSSPSSLG